MDPISLSLGLAGFGMKLLGGIFGSNDAERASEIQQQEAMAQGRVNEQKYQAMVLASRRQQMDILRNEQRARSMALNNAVNQGAQFGTGLQGGYGQISGQTSNNLLANSQSAQIGSNLFGLNSQMGDLNLQYSSAMSDVSRDQGLMSLGGSLITAGPTLGKIFGYGSAGNGYNYNSFNGFNSLFGGGSPSGYGR